VTIFVHEAGRSHRGCEVRLVPGEFVRLGPGVEERDTRKGRPMTDPHPIYTQLLAEREAASVDDLVDVGEVVQADR
jgi:hypothetical protein